MAEPTTEQLDETRRILAAADDYDNPDIHEARAVLTHRVPALLGEFQRLRAENQRLRDESNEYRESNLANGHVVLESGVTPGIDINCRCGDCRRVAKALDEAGYCEHIPADKQWWKREQEATE